MRYYPLFWLLIVMFFSSCKKEDTTPPTIQILSPSALSQYDVKETFKVEVKASDNKKLQYIKLSIADENLIDVSQTWVETVSDKDVNVTKYIFADDIHLSTGKYYIHAIASDGVNTSSDYLEIRLQAIPLALKNTYVLETNSTTTTLFEISGSATSYVYSFNGNYASGLANSYEQYLTLGANGNGGLYGYNTTYNTQQWKVAEQQTLYPFCIRSVEDEFTHLVTWSLGSGEVKSFDENGSVRNSLTIQTGFYPEDIYVNEDKIVVEEVGASSNRTLNVYNKGSGSFVQSYSLTGNLIAAKKRTSDELFLIVNENNSLAVYIYSIASNSAWKPIANQSGIPTGVAQVNEGQLIISTTSNCYIYSYQTSNVLSLASGNFSTVKYDYLNDVLLIVSGSVIYYYDRNGNALGTISHSGPIKDIWLYYNK